MLIGPATGNWSVVSGGASVVSAGDPNSTVTGLTVGVHVFEWTVDNGPCPTGVTSDQVTVTVYDDNAPSALAGPDQDLCGPVASTAMAGNTATFPATGEWSIATGPPSINIVNPADPTSSVTNLPVGIHVLRWTIDNGPCSNAITTDDVTINVFDPADPVANAGADIDLCTPATSTNLSGSTFTSPAVGFWTIISGTGTPTDAFDPNTAVTGLTVGTHVFQWNVDNGPCPNGLTTDQVTVNVFDDSNLAANAGPDQNLCTPITSTTLAGSAVIAPATGTWTLTSGTGVFTDPADPNTTVTGLVVGTSEYTWTVSNGPCSSPTTSDVVEVNIFNGSAQQADAGPDQSFCSTTTTATLAGNTPVGIATGLWTLVQGTGSITTAADPATTITGMGVGEIILQWSIDNGACGVSTDLVSIFVYDSNGPATDAGPDQDLCSPTFTTNLAGTVPTSPAIGTWVLVAGSGAITDVNDPSTSITGLAVGQNTFEWSIDNGPCPLGVNTDQVNIFVYDANNPIADAGPDQDICTPTASVTMAGSAVIFPALGTWSVISGPATITAPNDPTTTITGLGVGTITLQWEVNNGPCLPGITRDTVVVNIYDNNNPLANAGPDIQICIPTAPNSVILAGSSVTAPAVGIWTLVGGAGTFIDASDPTTLVSGLIVGDNFFVWTVSNGPCTTPLSSDTVMVSVFDESSPPANAGPDQNLCTPITTATMAGSAPIYPGVGTWSLTGGAGAITDVNDPNTTITALGVGVNTFMWSVNNGPCNPPLSTDEVSITLFDGNAQVANAGPDQDLCSDVPATTLGGNSVVGAATGLWTVVSGTANFNDVNNATTPVSGLSIGENVLYWTIDNGTCGSSVDSVSIFVYDVNNPAADAGPDQDLCTPITSTTLAANTPVFPAQGTWVLSSGTGTIVDVNDPNTTVSNLAIGTTVLTWVVNNGPCANPITSDDVTILVFDGNAQLADAGADENLCSDNPATTITGNAPIGAATGVWSVASGVAMIADPNAPITNVTAIGIGVADLVWTIDNGSCGLSRDTVSIYVYDENNPNADAGGDQNLCTPISSTSMNGSSVNFPAQGTWSLVSGSGTIDDVNDPLTQINGLTVGANVFEWSVDNGPCANGVTTDQVTIFIFNGNAQLADAGPDQSHCTPQDSALLVANAVSGVAVGTWDLVQGTGVFVDPNDPSTQVNGLSVGENIFEWSIDNGSCGTSVNEVSIFIYDENNPIANAGPDQELCTPTASTTLAGSAVIFPAQGTWSVISGTAQITDPNNPSTTITNLVVGPVVLQWQVDNGPCNNSPSVDLVTITLFDDAQANADAGADQNLCTPNLTTALDGNVATLPALGTWSLLSGSGVIANVNVSTSGVSGLAIGENVFVWSIFNGACGIGTTTDTVSIFVFDGATPAADAGIDQSICTPATTTSMSGSPAPFPAVGTWTLVSGSLVIDSPNDPTTTISALVVGTHVLEWTVDNGPCANGITADQVTVFVYDENNPVADAGSDILLCLPSVSTPLNGSNVISPAIGTWTVIGGTGTFLNLNDPLTTVTDLSVGVNTFVWTVDNGPCLSGISTDTVDVILFDNGGVPSDAGPDQFLCTPTTSTIMAASAVTFPEIGVWITQQGTGVFANVNDPSSSVSGLTIGENIFVWSVNNGPCPSGVTGDTMSVFVFDQFNLNADAGPDQLLCQPDTFTTFAGSAVTFPAIGTWTLVQGTGVVVDLNSPSSAVNGLSVGENIFAWTVDNGPCANGVTSDTMSIFIYSDTVLAANAGPDQSLCTPNTTATMVASPTYSRQQECGHLFPVVVQ